MDVMDAIRQRYSCRAYADKPVETEKLETLIEAARLAPSAKNVQDWRFVIITDPAKRKALQTAAAGQLFVGQAPIVLAACSISTQRMSLCAQPYAAINVAIALEHIALAATSLGLATCWVGAFKPQPVRKILHIPTHVTVVELMTVGYPREKGVSPRRLGADKIACREKWEFD